MPKVENTKVELYLPHEEWLDWNRAAQKAGSDLPSWIRTVVNAAQAAPAPSRKASPRARSEALHWDDEAGYAAACGYCGFPLEFTATRRKQYCSDECRVRAWRVRKRREAARRNARA
jgi:hypothetical protein